MLRLLQIDVINLITMVMDLKLKWVYSEIQLSCQVFSISYFCLDLKTETWDFEIPLDLRT